MDREMSVGQNTLDPEKTELNLSWSPARNKAWLCSGHLDIVFSGEKHKPWIRGQQRWNPLPQEPYSLGSLSVHLTSLLACAMSHLLGDVPVAHNKPLGFYEMEHLSTLETVLEF